MNGSSRNGSNSPRGELTCSSCQHPNPAGARFCQECGAQFSAGCTRCGTDLPPAAKFCHDCGQPTAAAEADPVPSSYTPKHLADKILRSKSALEGERKQITVLFADVQRSMALQETMDPEAWHTILEGFF